MRTPVILLLLTVFTSIMSCEKMLEIEVPENQIAKNNVFQDVQTANAALAALYSGLRDNSLLAGDKMGLYLSNYTDDLDCYATTATNGIYEIYQNQLIASNASVYSLWSNTYQQIYYSNSILEGLENSSGISDSDKKRIKGETLLIRCILYYYLQQIYGDIPYITNTDYIINSTISKLKSDDVLIRLENDLNECLILLADTYNNSERIFVNKKVADLMMAKVYFSENRISDAEVKLKTIIQSSIYSFETDITKVFQKSGKHILWQLKPKNVGDATKEASLFYFSGVAPSAYALSPSLMNSFANTDLRKSNWIAAVTVSSNTWYRAEKYKNRSNNTSEYSIVFRLEEIYLLLAESLAKQNKTVEALPYVNATRLRAGLATIPTGVSQSVLLAEIANENRREFFTEMGHRFFDLKRNGHLNTLLSTKSNWKTYHQLWPIPQNDLQLNINLNPQNPGY